MKKCYACDTQAERARAAETELEEIQNVLDRIGHDIDIWDQSPEYAEAALGQIRETLRGHYESS